MTPTGSEPAFHLVPILITQTSAGAREHQESVAHQRGACGADLRTRAEARVEQRVTVKRAQAFEHGIVYRLPRGLIHRFAVPVQAEPSEIVHDHAVGAGEHTWGGDVLDAQIDRLMARPCGKPRGEHGERVAQMHAPRR